MRIRTKVQVTEDHMKLLDALWVSARDKMRSKSKAAEDPAEIERMIRRYDCEIDSIRNIIREHGFMEAEIPKILRKIKLYKLAVGWLLVAFVWALLMIVCFWTGVI